MAATIAIAKVHQESSYGLDYILGSLATLSGGFAQWAFTKSNKGLNGSGTAESADLPPEPSNKE